MTESLLTEKEQHAIPAHQAFDGTTGVGATLRSMREARRVSVGEVSQRLKFSARQIEALEGEDWHKLPSGVSLRGFVRNYARYLEADVDAILAMLDSQVGPTAPRNVMTAPGPVASSGVDAEMPMAAEASGRSWGWFLAILALVVVAAFYAVDRGWVPESWLIFDWLKAIANNE